MLFYVNLSSVLVLGTKFLKMSRLHPEPQIIGEDRIIILEHSSDLTIVLAFQVKKHWRIVRYIGFREKVIKFREPEIACYGLYGHRSSCLLALVRISRDMRCRYIHHFHKFNIYIRFIVPGIDHSRAQLRKSFLQSGLIDYLTS